MKTFFTRLFVHFEAISHPASGWFTKSSTTPGTKKKASRRAGAKLPSPDSNNVRGRFSKKSNNSRITLAP
ncbi:MAG TPA: hypothetical protein VGE66_11170 [Chitinophagaceae bacterium]